MAKYRNITDDELFVAHLARSCKPDEVIEAPDDDREWPESTWAVVAPASKKKGDS